MALMALNCSRIEGESRFGRDFEVRRLPVSTVFTLSKLLEDQSSWRKVMALARKDPPDAGPCPLKYTAEHIRMIEDAAIKQQRAATAIFLEEWGCSGRSRPTVGALLELLVEAQLYGAADYIASELLHEELPPRPTSGPAAKVAWGHNENMDPHVHHLICPKPSAPQEFASTNSSETLSNSTLNRKTSEVEDMSSSISTKSTILSEKYESRRLGQEMETLCISQVDSINVALQHIPYNELFAVTNGFDTRPIVEAEGRLLGTGAFGSVFLGDLKHQLVAVKRLHKNVLNVDVSRHFFNEVEALSRVQHPNLLHLLGYSYDGPANCLVYEYMSHGNLMERLSCKGKMEEPLSWVERLKIGLGTAEGLLHLHSFRPRPILHRDVKSSNILLDANSQPKVGDFGLVRLGRTEEETQTVTTVIGTSAYMAPEAFRGDVSVKMDVFSFGVVLLELLTGLPPYDEEREGCDLVTHVTEICDNGSIFSLLDKSAGCWKSEVGLDVSEDLYGLAIKCLNEKKDRPEISTVVEALQTLCVLK